MGAISLFLSLAGMPLVGNAVTGVIAPGFETVGTHTTDKFLVGPSPDAFLGTFIRSGWGEFLGGARVVTRNSDL
jgi:hypothetical protein